VFAGPDSGHRLLAAKPAARPKHGGFFSVYDPKQMDLSAMGE